MHPSISAVDRVLHLAVFVALAVAFAVAALAVLERLADGRKTMRAGHIAAALAAAGILALSERIYHLMR